MSRNKGAGFSVPITDEDTELYAERLRDGRLALGTRRLVEGTWQPAELHVLDRPAFLALAGWLSTAVEDAWIDSARKRQPEVLRTAVELHGDGSGAAERLAADMLGQIPAPLLRRAMLLLVNSIGPEAQARMIEQLNRTSDHSMDALLRRHLAEAQEGLGYAVAAAALFDAIEEGVAGPAADQMPDDDIR